MIKKIITSFALLLFAASAFGADRTPYWSKDNKLYVHSVYSYQEIATLPFNIITALFPLGKPFPKEKVVVYFEVDPASGSARSVAREAMPRDFMASVKDLKVIKIPAVEKVAKRGIKRAVWWQGPKIAFNIFDRGRTFVVDRSDLNKVSEISYVRSDEIALSSKAPGRLFYTDYGSKRRSLKSMDFLKADAFPETLYEPPSGGIRNLKVSPNGEYLIFQSGKDVYLMRCADGDLKIVAQTEHDRYKLFGGKFR
jgi:hypothetical protein